MRARKLEKWTEVRRVDLSFKCDHNKFHYRVCAMIISGERILAMHDERSPYFYLPGGRVAMGETAEQAVIREVRGRTRYCCEDHSPGLAESGLFYRRGREPALSRTLHLFFDGCFRNRFAQQWGYIC